MLYLPISPHLQDQLEKDLVKLSLSNAALKVAADKQAAEMAALKVQRGQPRSSVAAQEARVERAVLGRHADEKPGWRR